MKLIAMEDSNHEFLLKYVLPRYMQMADLEECQYLADIHKTLVNAITPPKKPEQELVEIDGPVTLEVDLGEDQNG